MTKKECQRFFKVKIHRKILCFCWPYYNGKTMVSGHANAHEDRVVTRNAQVSFAHLLQV
jgi:hypothetical protein